MEALFCCAIPLVVFGLISLFGLREPQQNESQQQPPPAELVGQHEGEG